jgi:L-amino acid N-acyltransferase YncA
MAIVPLQGGTFFETLAPHKIFRRQFFVFTSFFTLIKNFMTTIRIATVDDAAAMLEIYTPYVLHTAFTFETEVPSTVQFQSRIKTYLEKYPWLVCSVDGRIVAYAYASTHREREAYQWTCECSVYVHSDFQGKGIGKELYAVLFDILKFQGYRNVYAGITMPNEASENMHKRSGFELFAIYENIGYKLERWHKVGWWKLQLNGFDLKPPPPQKFATIDHATFSKRFQRAARQIKL